MSVKKKKKKDSLTMEATKVSKERELIIFLLYLNYNLILQELNILFE